MAERGAYERAVIDAILDEALICHVGFVHEGGPVVIPTIHARAGDILYLHGSPASRMLRSMRSGDEICVTVTLVDGLVMARAPFHSSMNYRSVVVFGEPRLVEEPGGEVAGVRGAHRARLPRGVGRTAGFPTTRRSRGRWWRR